MSHVVALPVCDGMTMLEYGTVLEALSFEWNDLPSLGYDVRGCGPAGTLKVSSLRGGRPALDLNLYRRGSAATNWTALSYCYGPHAQERVDALAKITHIDEDLFGDVSGERQAVAVSGLYEVAGGANGGLDTQSLGPLAPLGSLIDADMEEVSARLQALQVQQQLGTQSLSIANQAPQALLSLFRG